MIELPSQEYLLANFSYCAETGQIVRLKNGKRAFGARNSDGYLQGRCAGVRTPFRAHRIAWKMHYGTDPQEIDHINGDRADNRISNLREVTHIENQRNRRVSRNNTSGISGVRWHSRDRCWFAQINILGRAKHLGSFQTREAAAAARMAAEEQLGFAKVVGN